jgi:hypothetical protein
MHVHTYMYTLGTLQYLGMSARCMHLCGTRVELWGNAQVPHFFTTSSMPRFGLDIKLEVHWLLESRWLDSGEARGLSFVRYPEKQGG